jgi:hypothetical protein
MLKDCLRGRITPLPCEGKGQSCALIVSQPGSQPSGGWVFELQARIADGLVVVRRVTLTAGFRARARVLAVAHMPTATEWLATAYPKSNAVQIRAGLLASDTPFVEPVDQELGQPGSKGWSYSVASVVNVPDGAWVKEISAVAASSGGSCTVTAPRDATTTEVLPAITIPAGLSFQLYRETLEGLVGPCTVTFSGTTARFVAWLE